MLLTRYSFCGNLGLKKQSLLGSLDAFNKEFCAMTRRKARFFMVELLREYASVACLTQVPMGRPTRNRLTTSLDAIGQVLKWNLKMTKAPLALSPRHLTLNHTVNHEPRIADIELAASLGLARPRTIRDVIVANKSELETYGSIAVSNGAYKGQPTNEYWLNESQALLLCMFSRTEKAAAVRKQVIDVFMAWRANKGQEIANQAPVEFVEPQHPFKQAVTWQELEVLIYKALGKSNSDHALSALVSILAETMEIKNNRHIKERNKACAEFYACNRKLIAA